MLQVQCITNADDLATLRADWERLKGDNPFLDPRWQFSWWEAFKAQHSLFVLAVRDQSTVRMIAPWYLSRSTSRGKQVQFLGSGRVCSDYLTLLGSSTAGDECIEALADWLSTNQEWDCLRLDGVAAADPAMAALNQALCRRGATSTLVPQPNFWRLPLPDTYDDFVAGCAKKIRQKLRKVERDTEGLVEFRLCTAQADILTNVERLVDLHCRRRSELGDAGCFCSIAFLDFIHAIAQDFFATGQLWLGQLDIDGQPAASCIGLEAAGVLYFYQTGANPDLAKLQPGWLLNIQLIRLAIERGLTAIDYLRGDEPYKARLSAIPVSHVRMQIASRRPVAQLRNQLLQAGSRLKQFACGKGGRPSDSV